MARRPRPRRIEGVTPRPSLPAALRLAAARLRKSCERTAIHQPGPYASDLGEALRRDLIGPIAGGMPGRVVEVDEIHCRDPGVEQRDVVVDHVMVGLCVEM